MRDDWRDPPLKGDPADPQGFAALSRRFIEHLRMKNFSAVTVRNRAYGLNYFIAWCLERDVKRPRDVTREHLERYRRALLHYRKKNGKPLSVDTQSQRLSALRVFFSWLVRQNHLLYNPASELELPKEEEKLPKAILTHAEAEAILTVPDVATPLGIRDRTILEVLYSTGMRAGELCNLTLRDIDYERGTVMIRHGKGARDRLTPIGERALAWLTKYVEAVRPLLVEDPRQETIFLSHRGEPWVSTNLSYRVGKIVRAAGVDKGGACHLFRHTAATLMLEGGADIRYIQQFLGHKKLTTTEIYTRVSIQKLKEVHTKTHPAARLRPSATLIDE